MMFTKSLTNWTLRLAKVFVILFVDGVSIYLHLYQYFIFIRKATNKNGLMRSVATPARYLSSSVLGNRSLYNLTDEELQMKEAGIIFKLTIWGTLFKRKL